MKKAFLLITALTLFACSKEEEAPEEVIPDPTTFLEKYNNTAWENSESGRIGFVDDTSRFLWTVPLVGDCSFISDNQTIEADGGIYSISIERNIPSEFVYTIVFSIGENSASYTKVFTESNDVLTETSVRSILGEQDEPEVITHTLISGSLSSYCQ